MKKSKEIKSLKLQIEFIRKDFRERKKNFQGTKGTDNLPSAD